MRTLTLLALCAASAVAHADDVPQSAPAQVVAPEPRTANAQAVIAAWAKAQNDGDFAAYSALYDPSFVGIKRTRNGGTARFTAATWKADRKKMFKAAQLVAVDRLALRFQPDRVIATLFQRYTSRGYADHGDKRLVLRTGQDGALRIVREEMLNSAPGWDGDPGAEHDASDLKSPIRAVVRQRVTDESKRDGCAPVEFELELADKAGGRVAVFFGPASVLGAEPGIPMWGYAEFGKDMLLGGWGTARPNVSDRSSARRTSKRSGEEIQPASPKISVCPLSIGRDPCGVSGRRRANSRRVCCATHPRSSRASRDVRRRLPETRGSTSVTALVLTGP